MKRKTFSFKMWKPINYIALEAKIMSLCIPYQYKYDNVFLTRYKIGSEHITDTTETIQLIFSNNT